jgi:hypothetical protein
MKLEVRLRIMFPHLNTNQVRPSFLRPHLNGVQVVGGSNPPAPTRQFNSPQTLITKSPLPSLLINHLYKAFHHYYFRYEYGGKK